MFEELKVDPSLKPQDPRFGCGPSKIPVAYVENLLKTGTNYLGTSHRKSAVKNVVAEVQSGLKKYFALPDDYQVVLGNGGATFLFDSIGLGLVKKKAAHFTCGEFSQKWFKSSKLNPFIEAEEFAVPYGEGIEPRDVPDADLICCTLNETSTGVQINDLPKIHEGALLAVDATSGAGQVKWPVNKTDIFFFSPQKVFASEGGLWIAILSPAAVKRAEEVAATGRYIPPIMSWELAIKNGLKNQTYNTPALTTIFFLNEQIKKMNQETYAGVIADGERKAKLIYGWAQQKPYLSCFIREPKFRSIVVATIDVDEKYNMADLCAALTKQHIAYGIEAYRNLNRNQLRIALFNNITYEDLEKLTKLVSAAIEGQK